MSFQAVTLLWWLLPLGAIIIALYLLRMTRKDYRVPATFLWPKRTEEVRANAPIQRLRFNWLMVLQLLAALLLVAALARPVLLQKGLTGSVTVFVIDGGASMQATDTPPNRFSLAVADVEHAISEARPQDQMAIILAGPIPKVLCPLSSDHSRLRSSLKGATGSDALPAMGEALRLSAALCANTEGARVVVLSDGTFAVPKDFSAGKAKVIYRAFGSSGENLAISAFGTAETSKGRSLLCTVTNHGLEPKTAPITVFADGAIADSRELRVASGAQTSFTLPVSPTSHVFEAKLDSHDALAADDYAVSVADAGAHLRVLLIAAGGDPFLEKALALDPRVTLDKTEKLPATEIVGSPGPPAYDLIVFDGVSEEPVKASATLTFGEPGPGSPASANGVVTSPRFSTAQDVPVLSGVDLSPVFVASASRVSPRNGGQIIAEARTQDGQDVPLVITSSAAKRQVYVSFRPGASDFPLQASFPIFVANALDFLAGSAPGGAFVVSTGAPISLPVSGAATLIGPDGVRTSVSPVGGHLVLPGLSKIGKYKLQTDDKTTSLYAILQNPEASSIRPQSQLVLGDSSVPRSAVPARLSDLWRYALLATLCALCAEWVLFVRRS